MKHLKRLALAAVAAAMLSLLTAAAASATTLEVGGVTKVEAITLQMSLKSGSSIITRDTAGFLQSTCTESVVEGATSSPYSGATVTAAVKAFAFNNCTQSNPTVHKAGTLHIEHVAGTTDGTVSWSGSEYTTSSPFGTLNCVTGAGTVYGPLTGVSKKREEEGSKHAAIDINAVLSCSGISSRMTGTYTVTSPTRLGVIA